MQAPDDHVLHTPHVCGSCLGTKAQVHDGIDDQLSGTVVGHVPTTVGTLQRRTHAGWIDEHMLRIGPHAQGVNVRVLEQQQVVVVGSSGDGMLKGAGLRVGHHAEPTDP